MSVLPEKQSEPCCYYTVHKHRVMPYHDPPNKLVTALKERGFKPHGGKARAKRPAAKRADTRFAHVLWGKLHKAGAVDQGGAKGLNAFIRARFEKSWGAATFDIDAMQDHRQIATVIEALKGMCARAGVEL